MVDKLDTAWGEVLTEAVERCLRPIVRLLLHLGMGASEFTSIAKTVYVQVASEEYGIRGRQTNMSRVAAMTGLSRKEVARIRSLANIIDWTPQQATTPLNEVLHYWHSDPEFYEEPGKPRRLPMEGAGGFETLVARYAGDIPAGAVRRELLSRGAVAIDANSMLIPLVRFVHSTGVDSDFLRNMAFTLEGLCATLAHNAQLVGNIGAGLPLSHEANGHFERKAWTSHLASDDIERFRQWARREGSAFIERADAEIGAYELPKESWEEADKRAIGVGLYYFELHKSPDSQRSFD